MKLFTKKHRSTYCNLKSTNLSVDSLLKAEGLLKKYKNKKITIVPIVDIVPIWLKGEMK